MLRCQFCYREAFLILNTCARCDPALHKSHDAALASVVNWDTVTPEMEKDFQILQHRKSAQQKGKNMPEKLTLTKVSYEHGIDKDGNEVIFEIHDIMIGDPIDISAQQSVHWTLRLLAWLKNIVRKTAS